MGKNKINPAELPGCSKKSRSSDECERRAKIKKELEECKKSVPSIKNCDKIDKKGTLRHISSYLKSLKSPPYQAAKPYRIDAGFLKLFNSFLANKRFLICNGSTTILRCTEGALTELGYKSTDVVGYRLTDHLIFDPYRDDFENEIEKLKNKLIETGDENCSFAIPTRMNEAAKPRQSAKTCRTVLFIGGVRLSEKVRSKLSPKCVVKRAKNGHISIGSIGEVGSDFDYDSAITIWGRIELYHVPPLQSPIISAFAYKKEYTLVTNMEGKIIFADPRIFNVLGYEPQEVIGLSAYKYILDDDKALSYGAHQKMLQDSTGSGCVVHRLVDAINNIIHLMSIGRILQTDNMPVVEMNIFKLSQQKGEEMRLQLQKQLEYIVGQKSPDDLESQLNAVVCIAKRGTSSNTHYSQCSTTSEMSIGSNQRSENRNSNFLSGDPNLKAFSCLDNHHSTSKVSPAEALGTLNDISRSQTIDYSPYTRAQSASIHGQVTIVTLPTTHCLYNTSNLIDTSDQHSSNELSHSQRLQTGIGAPIITQTIDSDYHTTNYQSNDNNNLTTDFENSFVDLNEYITDLEDETSYLKE